LPEDPRLVDRRTFLRSGALAASALLIRDPWTHRAWRAAPETGRLSTRFHKPAGDGALAPGEHVLAATGDRRSILFVPSTYDAKRPAPFCLALHGATGSGDSMLRGSRAAAEAHGVIVLSPSSNDFTWDAIRGGYADDFARIDSLMNQVFDRCSIDPRHIATDLERGGYRVRFDAFDGGHAATPAMRDTALAWFVN
jgi:poly(3-hydroxybutyrate) depolymerase